MIVRFPRIYIYHFLCIIIITAIVYELYLLVIARRDQRRAEVRKNINDYEAVLCKFEKRNPIKSSPQGCPPTGIITSFTPSGLCTNMWQYANIYAGSINTGLQGYMPVCMKTVLGEVFDHLSLPLLSKIGHCVIPLPDALTSIDDWSNNEDSIVIWDNDLYNTHVLWNLKTIMKDFVFTKNLSEYARMSLLSAREVMKNVTYIGMHIVNTHTIAEQDNDGRHPSVQFFHDAIFEFRKEFPNALFIVISDHELFWSSVFKEHKDVRIMWEESFLQEEKTLSVLSHCNHSILSSEGIGVWGALLSGGKAIVSLSLSESFNDLVRLRKGWNYLLNNSIVKNKDFKKFL